MLTTWPGACVELGKRLHDRLQSGQPMGTFPGLTLGTVNGSAAAAKPKEDTMAIVKAPGSDLAALVAVIREKRRQDQQGIPSCRCWGWRRLQMCPGSVHHRSDGSAEPEGRFLAQRT